jgi:hypothetical protein
MRPLRISDTTSVLGLQQEIQRSEESRYDHRLHGVLLVAQGMTCPEVARLLGDAPRSSAYCRVQTIVDWVHNYVTFGYEFARPTQTALEVFSGETRRLPRLPTPRDYFLPLHEYSGALCHRLSG